MTSLAGRSQSLGTRRLPTNSSRPTTKTPSELAASLSSGFTFRITTAEKPSESIQGSGRAILSDETECGLRVEEEERNSTSATNGGPLARLLHLCDGWNGGCCRFLAESLPLTQTFLESLHQVDHWCELRLGHSRHLLSLQLRFDQSLLPFLEPIVILLEVKGRGKTVDQLSGQHFLLFFQLDLVGLAVLGHLPDLVHVEHRVKGEAVGARPDDHRVLAGLA